MAATVDFDRVDQLLTAYLPRMEQDLLELLAYPSVEAAADGPDAPFGRPVAEALTRALQLAASHGLVTENIDGYMGIARLPGQSSEEVGVLTHLDVVPANAAEWTSPPFAPEVREEKIFGRGSLDDKGPLIATLYATLALAEVATQPLPRTVTLMFGCNEETRCECLSYYLRHFPPPSRGFSPDAEFPLIIGEKGIIHFSLEDEWQDQEAGEAPLVLVNASAGSAANIVPGAAEAELRLNRGPEPTSHGAVSVKRQGDRILVRASGKAAHASLPEEGENALSALLAYLSELELAPSGAARYIRILAELFHDSRYGSSLGLAAEDEYSRLTLIPSVLWLDAGHGSLTCDMRFPVSHNMAQYREVLQDICDKYALRLGIFEGHEPMLAERDDETVRRLLKAYRDFSGDLSEPLIIGGGTYAKDLPGVLAFGPIFAHTPNLCHQADEYISAADLLASAKIYARAIYELCL